MDMVIRDLAGDEATVPVAVVLLLVGDGGHCTRPARIAPSQSPVAPSGADAVKEIVTIDRETGRQTDPRG